MNRILFASALFFAPSLALASDQSGTWSVDDAASALFYVTTKKEHVAERHVVPGITGGLTADGVLRVELDMASVTSGVDVRDNRLREHLYKVAEHPKAIFSGEIDMAEYEGLGIGESMESVVEGDLEIAGVEGFVDFTVMVTRAGEGRVVVSSYGPIIVDSADFELSEGIDTLRELAKLPHISYMVPVTFTLAFDRG